MKIAITMGDPAGIGPEVIVKALADPEIAPRAEWKIVGSRAALGAAERVTGLKLPESASVLETEKAAAAPPPGELSAEAGRAAVEAIRGATRLCLEGWADAMVTAPVNKEAVTLAGERHFSGHTDFIAELCGARDTRMLLVSEKLRVVHVTTHIPLRKACEINKDRVRRTIEMAHEAGVLLGFEQPRIAVCGLNPHAGEHSLFGREDADVIRPAVISFINTQIRCEGPLPADTAFLRTVRGEYDLVVAMYHDQGHIPIKLLDFEHTVNVSLGLPIIRTSVDHGTAFDIAGKGIAAPGSMKAALRLAVEMAGRSKHDLSRR